MNKKNITVPLLLSDEVLNDLPVLRGLLMRRLWYDAYRAYRIKRREELERLLNGNGTAQNMMGILKPL